MRHLQARTAEATFDVESFVGFAAVENALVASDLGGDVVEGLDQTETELLALLVLGDGDVLDVADVAKAVNATKVERDILSAGSSMPGREQRRKKASQCDEGRRTTSSQQLAHQYQPQSSPTGWCLR